MSNGWIWNQDVSQTYNDGNAVALGHGAVAASGGIGGAVTTGNGDTVANGTGSVAGNGDTVANGTHNVQGYGNWVSDSGHTDLHSYGSGATTWDNNSDSRYGSHYGDRGGWGHGSDYGDRGGWGHGSDYGDRDWRGRGDRGSWGHGSDYGDRDRWGHGDRDRWGHGDRDRWGHGSDCDDKGRWHHWPEPHTVTHCYDNDTHIDHGCLGDSYTEDTNHCVTSMDACHDPFNAGHMAI
jgi:hypothetical protein